jgi:FKBP-type peptidyl-prolyl cis-trans isomerase FkpA
MKHRQWTFAGLVLAHLAACGGPAADREEDGAGAGEAPSGEAPSGEAAGTENSAPASGAGGASGEAAEPTEIVPGLTMRVLEAGSGATAEAGQTAVVHYTGWLYDRQASDNRGEKFDSSVDRGQPFEFTLGAGDVISGWDQGVLGMQPGELRELRIAPELAYGQRGAGDVIPPGATLIFEVELIELRDPRVST